MNNKTLISTLFDEGRVQTKEGQNSEITIQVHGGEGVSQMTSRITSLSRGLLKMFVIDKVRNTYILKGATDGYEGTVLDVLEDSQTHQNIFLAPMAVICKVSNSYATILSLEDGSIREIPLNTINSREGYNGYLYFDDFDQLLQYGLSHKD